MGLEIINKLKKEQGLTNEELSLKSGIPLGTLSKITSGVTKDPKLETLKAIAKVLNCSLDDFDDDTIKTNYNISLNKEEIDLIINYRKLSEKTKTLIDTIITLELFDEIK